VEAYDVIVVGVGGMGSATVAHLARRGVQVWGLSSMISPMSVAHLTASRASFVWPTLSILPMSHCCTAPMSCGGRWNATSRSVC